MQIRSKTYLQMISWLRALHNSLSPNKEPSSREVSPPLIFVAVVLAVLLAMLEIDLHTPELQSIGLTGDAFPTDPVFQGPLGLFLVMRLLRCSFYQRARRVALLSSPPRQI